MLCCTDPFTSLPAGVHPANQIFQGTFWISHPHLENCRRLLFRHHWESFFRSDGSVLLRNINTEEYVSLPPDTNVQRVLECDACVASGQLACRQGGFPCVYCRAMHYDCTPREPWVIDGYVNGERVLRRLAMVQFSLSPAPQPSLPPPAPPAPAPKAAAPSTSTTVRAPLVPVRDRPVAQAVTTNPDFFGRCNETAPWDVDDDGLEDSITLPEMIT